MFYEKLNEQQTVDRNKIQSDIQKMFAKNLKPIRFGRNRRFNLNKNTRALEAHAVHRLLNEWYEIIRDQFYAIVQEHMDALCYYEWHKKHYGAGTEITYLVVSQNALQNAIVRLCSLIDVVAQLINTRYHYYQNENEVDRAKIKEALRLTNRRALLSILNDLDSEIGKIRKWRNTAIHQGKFTLYPTPKMDVRRRNGRIVGAGFGMQKGIEPHRVFQQVFQTIKKVNAILPKLVKYMNSSITNIRKSI